MRDEEFEWDDRKAASNLRDHGVSFDMARVVFDDPYAVASDDFTPDEDRFNLIGMVDGVVLHVTYTDRGKRTRIISARPAVPYERRIYHEQGN